MTDFAKRDFGSHVDLPADARTALVETLNVALATTIDLQLQVKQAHWNIKGPQFFARHELFDKIAARLRAASDEFAERASTLGGYAAGTIRVSAERTQLPEYELDVVDGKQHIRVLVERFGKYSSLLRDSIRVSQKLEDPVTEDLFTGILRNAELDLWFLDSHLRV